MISTRPASKSRKPAATRSTHVAGRAKPPARQVPATRSGLRGRPEVVGRATAPRTPTLPARPMVPPSPRDLDIYRLRYLEQFSIRLLADRFSLSPTRIRQLLYRVQVWLSLVLPPTDEPTQAQLAHLAQHLVAGQLQFQIDCLADQWEGTHDLRCLRLQSQLLMMLAKLGVPPGTIEGLLAEACEDPELFGLTLQTEPDAEAARSKLAPAAEPPPQLREAPAQPIAAEATFQAASQTSLQAAPPTSAPCDAAPPAAAAELFAEPSTLPGEAESAAQEGKQEELATQTGEAKRTAQESQQEPAGQASKAELAAEAAQAAAPFAALAAEPSPAAARKSPRKRTARGTAVRGRSRRSSMPGSGGVTSCQTTDSKPSPTEEQVSSPSVPPPCAGSSEEGHGEPPLPAAWWIGVDGLA